MKHTKPVILTAVAAAMCLIGLPGPANEAAAEEYILKNGKWVAAPKAQKGTVSGELAMIRKMLAAGQFKAARDEADAFVKAHPDSPACEEAMLLGAQAEIDRGLYYQAFERLQAMIAKYPNGTFLERALAREMQCAEAFLAGKKRIVGRILRLPATDEGLTILRKVFEHAPGTDIAERAILRIGDFHFSRKAYDDAVDAYDEFLALHPRSARVPAVMAKAASAMYESFKGVAYDETPLVEAENRYKAMIEQYPDEARKAKAPEVLREIQTIRAERAFETAKFYERTNRPKSAQYYYRKVVEEFPATAWASEARSKVTPRRRTRAVKATTTPPAKKPTGAASSPRVAKPAPKPANPTSPPRADSASSPRAVTPGTGKGPTEDVKTTVTVPEGPTLLVPDRDTKAGSHRKPAAPSSVNTTTAPAAREPDDSLLERLLESESPTTQPAGKTTAADKSKGASK